VLLSVGCNYSPTPHQSPFFCSGALAGTELQSPISSGYHGNLSLSHSSCGAWARLAPSLNPATLQASADALGGPGSLRRGKRLRGFGMPPLRFGTGPRRLIGVGSLGSPLRSLNLSGFKVPLCSTFKPSLAQRSPSASRLLSATPSSPLPSYSSP